MLGLGPDIEDIIGKEKITHAEYYTLSGALHEQIRNALACDNLGWALHNIRLLRSKRIFTDWNEIIRAAITSHSKHISILLGKSQEYNPNIDFNALIKTAIESKNYAMLYKIIDLCNEHHRPLNLSYIEQASVVVRQALEQLEQSLGQNPMIVQRQDRLHFPDIGAPEYEAFPVAQFNANNPGKRKKPDVTDPLALSNKKNKTAYLN